MSPFVVCDSAGFGYGVGDPQACGWTVRYRTSGAAPGAKGWVGQGLALEMDNDILVVGYCLPIPNSKVMGPQRSKGPAAPCGFRKGIFSVR